MSAFIVSRTHIDAMLTAGVKGNARGLSWYAADIPTEWESTEQYHAWFAENRRELTYSTADRVGVMLMIENRVSVRYRYPDSTADMMPGPIPLPDPDRYTFRELRGNVDPAAALAAIKCYEYQSCEHPGWRASEARFFCDALRDALIYRLPGTDGVWEIDDRDFFLKRAYA